MGMATALAAWRARAEPLQDRVEVWVLAGWRSSTGGRGRCLVEIREGEGFNRGICIGLPFPLDANQIGQTEKVFEDPSMPREISSRSLPPLGRFARIKKEEREKTGLGTLWPNFKI
jgi:hypothetical protein